MKAEILVEGENRMPFCPFALMTAHAFPALASLPRCKAKPHKGPHCGVARALGAACRYWVGAVRSIAAVLADLVSAFLLAGTIAADPLPARR